MSKLVTVPDLLRERAAAVGDQVALAADGGESITYAAWEARSNAVAAGLRRRGFGRGDRIALYFQGTDWIDYAVAYFGVLKVGATATHLSEPLGAAEIERRIEHARPAGLIHGQAEAPPPFDGWTVSMKGAEAWPPQVRISVRPKDISDIFYTSGTTGPAKPYTNPHAIFSFGRQMARAARFDPDAPLIVPVKLGSPAGAGTVAVFALNSSATTVLCDPSNVERVAELVAIHRCRSIMLTPIMVIEMLTTRTYERHDLSSLRTIALAGGFLPPRYGRELLRVLPGITVMIAYGGGSEASPAAIAGSYSPNRPNCMGKPRPGTSCKLTGPGGEPVPPETIGEIWLRTDAPKRLYLDADLNRTVHVDGWTRTGDYGFFNDRGEFFFFDRGTDVIRTPMGMVSSLQVEAELYEHPEVREVAVVGVTQPDGTQAVAAFVVPQPGTAPRVSNLVEFATGRLAPHQIPSMVIFRDRFPRGLHSGKVLKRQLLRSFADAQE